MSRAPQPAAKGAPWKDIDEAAERYGAPVLVTSAPDKDQPGTLATFYHRRENRGGKWVPLADWVDVQTRAPLDPQPTHWRPDPGRGRLDPEGSVKPEKAAA